MADDSLSSRDHTRASGVSAGPAVAQVAGPSPATAPAPGTTRPWSLQRRLRGQLLATLAVAWLLGSAAASLALWRETDEVLDSGLAETAEHLLMLPDVVLDLHDRAERDLQREPHARHVIYQVADADGLLRLRSHHAPMALLDPGAPDGARRSGPWHVLTLSTPDGQRRAQVAEAVAHRSQVLWDSLRWLLAVLLALLPGAAWALDWLLRRAFATLEPARQALESREDHDMRPVDVGPAPTELQPWLAAVNRLLGRVRTQVDSERAFAANTAHELRTPLAAARAQAQRLLDSTSDPTHRAPAEALVRQLDRLTRLATRLLQLARIESGVALQRDAVDLVALVLLVADDFAEAQRQGRLTLQVLRQPRPVQGDIDALGIALRNLIDNGLKHGGDQATVEVVIDGDRLRVQDNGPGVPADRLAGLTRKFDRAGAGTTPGSGLGLAMVETIARQSDARLVLQSPLADGCGFSAELQFGRPA